MGEGVSEKAIVIGSTCGAASRYDDGGVRVIFLSFRRRSCRAGRGQLPSANAVIQYRVVRGCSGARGHEARRSQDNIGYRQSLYTVCGLRRKFCGPMPMGMIETTKKMPHRHCFSLQGQDLTSPVHMRPLSQAISSYA